MRLLVPAAVALLASCTSEPTAVRPVARDVPASAVVLPASAYRAKLPFSGVHSSLLDVNDQGVMVGFVDQDAIWYQLNGARYVLNNAGGTAAEARAVNSSGEAAGNVYNRAVHLLQPAIWTTPTSAPLLRPEWGWVWDMNDQATAVGIFLHNGINTAFVWESRSGSFTALPFPSGARWTQAYGINNDMVIVGSSDVGGVMWRQQASGWVATILRRINPWAIDAGYGTVGQDRATSQPAWGKPNLAGWFGVYGVANGINPDGTVSGEVSGVPGGLPQPFVADRSGTITMLPLPPGYMQGIAYNSARCGLAVGAVYNQAIFAYEGVYWDPGC